MEVKPLDAGMKSLTLLWARMEWTHGYPLTQKEDI